ncbi:hypothetical protein POX_g09111 [Penicillium oxalicum]|uniref:hypothetical protein n=1 Tax=Penicillium oxalicum TaxID=69781 RepID=UPI0020B6C95B|nr:hypothetical protein POX_g09111 [Penicillium oxalicum]KAI2786721.1 hypothetical protein POX_g09111 [Penicillium oxalicum]
MAGNDSTPKGKTPTRTTTTEPDSDDERDIEIQNLKTIVGQLREHLDQLGANYNVHSTSVKDYLEQLHAQVVASAPATTVRAPKLPKAETFDSNRQKLRGFLTQIDIHIDVNKGRLVSEGSKHLERTFGDIDAKKTAKRKLKRIRQTRPKPIELDAARLPSNEEKRRRDNNLCFEYEKQGTGRRKTQQRKATTNKGNPGRLGSASAATSHRRCSKTPLRNGKKVRIATNREGDWASMRNQTKKGKTLDTFDDYEERAEVIRQITKDITPGTFADDIVYRGLISAEHATEEFPEID